MGFLYADFAFGDRVVYRIVYDTQQVMGYNEKR